MTDSHSSQEGEVKAQKVVISGQITNSDLLFNNISIEICTKYTELGIELGLQSRVLTNELETGAFVMLPGNRKAMKMLQLWRDSVNKDNFTYSVLAAALEKHGFHRCAHEYCYTSIDTSNYEDHHRKIRRVDESSAIVDSAVTIVSSMSSHFQPINAAPSTVYSQTTVYYPSEQSYDDSHRHKLPKRVHQPNVLQFDHPGKTSLGYWPSTSHLYKHPDHAHQPNMSQFDHPQRTHFGHSTSNPYLQSNKPPDRAHQPNISPYHYPQSHGMTSLGHGPSTAHIRSHEPPDHAHQPNMSPYHHQQSHGRTNLGHGPSTPHSHKYPDHAHQPNMPQFNRPQPPGRTSLWHLTSNSHLQSHKTSGHDHQPNVSPYHYPQTPGMKSLGQGPSTSHPRSHEPPDRAHQPNMSPYHHPQPPGRTNLGHGPSTSHPHNHPDHAHQPNMPQFDHPQPAGRTSLGYLTSNSHLQSHETSDRAHQPNISPYYPQSHGITSFGHGPHPRSHEPPDRAHQPNISPYHHPQSPGRTSLGYAHPPNMQQFHLSQFTEVTRLGHLSTTPCIPSTFDYRHPNVPQCISSAIPPLPSHHSSNSNVTSTYEQNVPIYSDPLFCGSMSRITSSVFSSNQFASNTVLGIDPYNNPATLPDAAHSSFTNQPPSHVSSYTELNIPVNHTQTSIDPPQVIPTASQAHSSPSPALLLSSQLQMYRPKLAKIYAYQSNIPQDVWPPVRKVHYINLALIKKKKLDIGSEYERHTIRGSIDDIFQEKDEIKYSSVFEDVEDGARILFEGRPGCGKTTVMHKISQDWEKGEIFSSSLLFLVTLRHFGSKSNINLADIIQSATKDFSQEEVTHLCKCIEKDGGRGFVFVLDGLDEYRPEKKKDNLIFDLIGGRKLLNSVIIVASRPAASQKFRKCVSKHIEVLGFLKPQIDEYIDSYYAENADQGVELKKYLEQHPNVFHMCYLPIHMVMVTYLFEKMGSSLPQTETEIYHSFTLHTLVRSLCKREDSGDAELVNLKSFNDLEGDDVIVFEFILQLAFTATVKSKQVFLRSEEEMKKLFSSTQHNQASENKLGLLLVDRHNTMTGTDEMYTFLHLTFQEYLAACYVARLDPSKQKEIIEKYSKKKHLAVVWKFYCGMTGSKFTNEDVMKNFELLMNQSALNNLQCAHESQQKCVCTCVVQSNNAEIKLNKESLNAADCTALSYVLVNSEVPAKVVELTSCHLGPESFTSFVKGCDGQSLPLQSLSLQHSKITKETEASFCVLLNVCPSLQRLDISFCGIQYGTFQNMSSNFPQLSMLETLDLSSNPLGRKSTPLLKRFLEMTPNLQILRIDLVIGYIDICRERTISLRVGDTIDLSRIKIEAQNIAEILSYPENVVQVLRLGWCNIGDAEAKTISEGLKHCTAIRTLELQNNEIGVAGAQAIGEGLNHCTSIQTLELDRNKIGDAGAQAIGEGLKHCTSIQTLVLWSNEIGDAGAQAIGESLKHCTSIQTLQLQNNEIGDAGAQAIGEGLKHCTNIQTLQLQHSEIGDAGAQAIGEALKHCTSIQTLGLSLNKIGDAGGQAIGEGLKHCTSIQTLQLHNNQIGDAGAQAIGENLKHCTSIQTLELFNNKIGDAGAQAIGEGLKHCTSIQTLNISDNKIGDAGAQAISEGLKHCTSIQTLTFFQNSITDKSVNVFCELIETAKQLKYLYLEVNNMTSAGKAAIRSAKKKRESNPDFVKLDLCI